MENNRPYWKVIVSLAFSLLATALVVVAGVWGIRFLLPFVIGWLISCIANPIVCWLEKKARFEKKIGSAIIIVVVLGVVIGLLYLIIALLVKEIGSWIFSLPDLMKEMSHEMDKIGENLSGILNMLPKSIRSSWNSITGSVGSAIGKWVGDLGEPTVTMAGNVAKQVPTIIIGIFVTILSAYFFVADRDTVVTWVKKVTPKAIYKRLSVAMTSFKQAVGGYFLAQFKIMLIICAILLVGLSLLKVEYAIVLSILIGFLDFLPFFGTGTAFIPWSIYTVLTGDYMKALFLVIIYVITQVVHHMIQPKLVGDEVGLNPLPTLLFIYIGYRMGGFLWMILAVPLGKILINMYKTGAFDYILDDVKILVRGVLSLREKEKTS